MMQRLLFFAAAVQQTNALAPAARRPEPSRLENTQNYRDATAASARFNSELRAPQPKKVAIIGGGISGLSTAYRLQQKGIEFTLFEESSRFGGNIQTVRHGDLVYDAGPDSFLKAKTAPLELAEELGLGQELITPKPEGRKVYVGFRQKLANAL